MIWKRPFTQEAINALLKNTICSHLDIQVSASGADWLEATMPVDHRTHQPMGILHGGASVVLAESLGSIAGLLCIENPKKQSVVGLEINANHLKSVKKGLVTGRVTPIRVGRKIQVWNIVIKDEEQRDICVSRITLAVVDI